MNENEYQDAINCLTQELADFKAEVSAKLAEMADRTKDVLEGYDERIKGHVDFTAEVVEKVEKNFVRGNEIVGGLTRQLRRAGVRPGDSIVSPCVPMPSICWSTPLRR